MRTPQEQQEPEQSSDNRSEPSPGAVRRERRQTAALDALRALIRDGYHDRFGKAAPNAEACDLQLSLTAQPGEDWQVTFTPPLEEQLALQLEGIQASRGKYMPGCVYCFRCNSSCCAHAVPSTSLQVFAGYSETGCPEWEDFAQTLIAARDERVDHLFRKPPGLVTRITRGKDLQHRQMTSFGRASKTYSILGQVSVGYLVLDDINTREGTGAKTALTFQVAETRSDDGSFRLVLNSLMALPAGATLDELYATGWNPWLRRAQQLAKREVEALEENVLVARAKRDTAAMRKALSGVPGILRKLAGSINSGYRQSKRRTKHAEQRRKANRPVHMAVSDTAKAGTDDLFEDVKTSAVIARGPHGRCHVFSTDGKHITSFVIKPDSVSFRLRTNRWRPLPEEEGVAFKEARTAVERRLEGNDR
jgi:hypothetical protein